MLRVLDLTKGKQLAMLTRNTRFFCSINIDATNILFLLIPMFVLFAAFLVFLSIGCTAVRCRNNEYLNPDWVDPHDWKSDQDPLQQLCPQTQPHEHSAKSEYLRLVNSFFNPDEFRVRSSFI